VVAGFQRDTLPVAAQVMLLIVLGACGSRRSSATADLTISALLLAKIIFANLCGFETAPTPFACASHRKRRLPDPKGALLGNRIVFF
jgi:hypothetical protein